MKKNVDVKREGVVEKLKKSQSLLSMVQMLERNNSLCFKYMSCIIFDLSDVSLCPLKWKTKVFQQNGRKKDMHSILHEDAILEKKKKNTMRTQASLAKTNLRRKKKETKSLKILGLILNISFRDQGRCNNYGHLFGKYRTQILKRENLCRDYHISSYQVNFQSQGTMLKMLLQLSWFI